MGLFDRGAVRFVGLGVMEVCVLGLSRRNTEVGVGVKGLGTVWSGKGKGKG